jgi:hypothetical protein
MASKGLVNWAVSTRARSPRCWDPTNGRNVVTLIVVNGWMAWGSWSELSHAAGNLSFYDLEAETFKSTKEYLVAPQLQIWDCELKYGFNDDSCMLRAIRLLGLEMNKRTVTWWITSHLSVSTVRTRDSQSQCDSCDHWLRSCTFSMFHNCERHLVLMETDSWWHSEVVKPTARRISRRPRAIQQVRLLRFNDSCFFTDYQGQLRRRSVYLCGCERSVAWRAGVSRIFSRCTFGIDFDARMGESWFSVSGVLSWSGRRRPIVSLVELHFEVQPMNHNVLNHSARGMRKWQRRCSFLLVHSTI